MQKSNKSILFFAAVLSILLSVSAEAELSKQQISSLFDQANEAFRQANSSTEDSDRDKLYEKAVLIYEKIIDQGQVKNAGLYYNLANVYLLKQDIGRAILNYRRALKLDSGDLNIRKNLSFARSRRADKVETETEKRVFHTLFFWHYDFSIKTRFFLACLCFGILCIAITIMVWLGRKAPLITASIIFGILTACFTSSVIVEQKIENSKICGVVTAEQIVARQGDGQAYPTSFKEPLHAGIEFELIEARPGWMHIKLSDGSEGWIQENTAELI